MSRINKRKNHNNHRLPLNQYLKQKQLRLQREEEAAWSAAAAKQLKEEERAGEVRSLFDLLAATEKVAAEIAASAAAGLAAALAATPSLITTRMKR
ncbi:hypothetical protein GLAREA_06178 [Glarea lozoyensis ATCC 20868]|uniref:Uncharacterized protein n=2 Tax=Glarea lozoyensis TaxID=101852 RepID=S3DM63_GLAL2|nr:uncharacterized protein GLAREA_06178 [Glarea lozoyensis ATCC 20868]EHL00470.1 hypothetical protein M7I_3554 [Glarea lozoyensis 74030]EPE33166.1 hypothetical protein GLAREA_06178 [Glarea lozoyensis ATCC 20868]